MTDTKDVNYRFGPRDRAGWLLGLTGTQCISLATGVVAAGTLLNGGAPAVLIFVPILLAAGFAFGTWQGQPIHRIAPVVAMWHCAKVTGRHRWTAPLPRRRSDGRPVRTQPALPPVLDGISIVEADAPWTAQGRLEGAAMVRDRIERTVAAVLRVAGREFTLCERSEQQRLLAMWGDALSSFCAERGSVARIRWIEWAAPADLHDQLDYLASHQAAPETAPAVVEYRGLLNGAGPMSTRHVVLVAVTVSERRMRRRRGETSPSVEETLLEEIRLLSGRLENAGLTVDPPLSPTELAQVLRSRLDPHASPRSGTDRKPSLTELAGLVAMANAGPLTLEADFAHVRVGRTWHAAYVVAEWPRLDVPPNWMDPLLLHAGGVRTVAVHYEPVPHSRSQRQIDRDTVKLAADEEQRHRQGFRIGARHRRAQAEVAAREAELVAGYPEFEYIGTVHIAAPDPTSLERSCAEYEELAAQIGLELRRLDGQHDLALPCLLPIGRGIAGRRGLA